MSLLQNILLSNYIIILICYITSTLLGLVIFGLSYFIGNQNPDAEKLSAYECGFEPFEDARNKFDVRFYIVAILFIIFDIEVLYLFPWCINLSYICGEGFWSMIIFLSILTIGFFYEIIKKALDWQ